MTFITFDSNTEPKERDVMTLRFVEEFVRKGLRLQAVPGGKGDCPLFCGKT